MRAIVATRDVYMASSPDRVWPLLADTDRFSRISGASEVHFRPIEDEAEGTGARFVAETRASGFKLVYEEYPFEWSYLKTFGVHRRMRNSPVSSYTWRVTLSPTRGGEAPGAVEGGTCASVRFEIVPRSWATWPIARYNAAHFPSRFEALCAEVDAHLVGGTPSPYVRPVGPSDPALVDAAVARLREGGVSEPLAERLGMLIREGADADLVRIRPFSLADEWEVDRREMLGACLHAVPAGLFELRWALVCPSCLTASQVARGLEEIAAAGHCQLCDISFDLDLDRAVEATFVPHPSVRRVPEAMFCIGGPTRVPHVLMQALVQPGEERALDAPPEAGRYRLFVRGGVAATLEIAAGAPETVRATLGEEGIEPAQLRAAPGGRIVVQARWASPRHVKIERMTFAEAAATAHEVTTLPAFRTLFSSDLLKRGTPLKVARAAVLFSDLTGSTALYTSVGDAAAFRLVDDHFDVLRAVVADHGGAVIKTMGDAVMAAFVDATQCARAALDALERFERFRSEARHGDLVGLKLGLFAGACYVVTANGALDYFGQTVNCAARVQHLAGSGELVLPVAVLDALGEADRARVVELERFEARVKGVADALSLARVRLAAASA